MPYAAGICRREAHIRLTWLSLHPASRAVSAMLDPPSRKATTRACSARFGFLPGVGSG